MSEQRNDSDNRSSSLDCRYHDGPVLDGPGRSESVTPSDRSRPSTRTTASNASVDRFGRSVLSVSGIMLLTVTKLLDALTTGIGLLLLPDIYEANPLARFAFHQTGVVVGLAAASTAVIAVILVVVETCSILVSVRRWDGHLAPVVRLVGYGLPSLLFAVIAVHNVGVLLSRVQTAIPL